MTAWPTTRGVIESIEVVSEFQQRSGSSGQHAYWVVNVSYNYKVNGVQQLGRRLSNAPPQESLNLHKQPSAKLTQYTQRYTVGKQVNVHYDPEKPDRAFLEIDTGYARIFGIVAAIAFVIGATFLILRNRASGLA